MKTLYIYLCCLSALVMPAALHAQSEAAPATLLGRWKGENLPGSDIYDNTYNEIWGLALNGREYAVIGSTLGTHFIDVTRPQDAEEVAFVSGGASGSFIIHRDYHNYGCYLYAVSDEGNGGLQIMDVSALPDTVKVVYQETTFFGRSHNIFIDSSRAVLYACFPRGAGTSAAPLKLLDISDPLNPRELAAYNQFGSGPVSHVHDCFVEDGIAFLNLGFDGMAIVDFTNPKEPVFLSTLTDYLFSGYNHSGWPTTDLNYYYLGDESHGFDLKVLDVSDRSEIEVVTTFNAGSTDELSIPHNQIVACNYLYVSYYYDGMQVYDISDPARPQRISYFGTSSRPHRKSYEGAWGIYPFLPSGNVLVSDMQEGLFVLSGPDGNCPGNDDMILQCDLLNPIQTPPTGGDGWRVYPVPASDRLNMVLEGHKGQEKVNVQLLDIQGRLVQRWEKEIIFGKLELTLQPAIPAGMYFLQLRSDTWRFTKKVLIGP